MNWRVSHGPRTRIASPCFDCTRYYADTQTRASCLCLPNDVSQGKREPQSQHQLQPECRGARDGQPADIRVTGDTCAATGGIVNGDYVYQGNVADGKPYYAHDTQTAHTG